MIYGPKFFIESNAYKSIVITKDLINDIKLESSNYWHGFLFDEKYLNVNLKQDFTTITLDGTNRHKVPYCYIEIDDQPILYILPEKWEAVDYFDEDTKIISKIYSWLIMDWLQKHYNKPFLINLYETFTFISSEISEILSSVKVCKDFDYNEIPKEILENIKHAFMAHYYNAILYDTIRKYGQEILESLGLLSEYSNKKKNKDARHSKSNISMNKLIDLYNSNAEFRSNIEKHVKETLEHNWMKTERDNNFRKNVVRAYNTALFFVEEECHYKKVLIIVFHNEIYRILTENKYFIHVELGHKTITINTFGLINNKKSFINWLYGSFNSFSNLSVLEAKAYRFQCYTDDGEPCDFDHICYGRFSEIKSCEVIYDKSGPKISNLIVDCLFPNVNSLSVQFSIQLSISLNNNNFKIILNNTRLMTNLILNFSNFYVLLDKFLNSHHNVNKEPLLICNLTIPMNLSPLEEDE